MTLRRFLVLMLATGGALLAQDAPNATGAKKRIVVLGDSITAGYGLDPQEAYPALLQKKIDAAKLPYTAISRTMHIHPTVSELVPTLLQDLTPLT